MNKKFATVGVVFTLLLTTCSSPIAEAREVQQVSHTVSFVETIKIAEGKKAIAVKKAALKKKLDSNTRKIKGVIKKLKKQVGKTYYVFSGSTPSGWDCSGLVMWAYKDLGINLEHSASVQKNSGKKVKTPKVGDIVAFGWKGYDGAGHVGIYVGNGKMIHVGKKGEATEIVGINEWAGNRYSKITYTRIVNTV